MAFRPSIKAAALGLLLLAGCGDDTQVVDLSAPSFDKSPVYRMNVAEIRVVDDFEPSFGGNRVEHLFATSPARGVGIWANDRLQAAGPQGAIEVHVVDASVVETKGDQFDRFDANVSVVVKLYDGVHPLVAAEAQAQAKLSRNLEKSDSVARREDLFAAMTRELTASIDQTLDRNIRQNFGRYILAVQPR